jgi:uncharacterized membrane protein
MNSARLLWVGLAIILIGFLVVAAGAFLGSGGSSSIGGFFLIGPVPIVFGNGPNSGTLASVALAISVLMVVVYLVSFVFWGVRRRRKVEARTEPESE